MRLERIKFSEYKKEITSLRQLAWKERTKFPSENLIIQDKLDESDLSIHWGVFNDHELIASCRVSILSTIEQLPYKDIFKDLDLLFSHNFAFYSRLVIHPDYRKKGLAKELDEIRVNELKNQNVKLALATARDWRLNYLIGEGWKMVKPVEEEYVEKYSIGNTTIICFEL